MASGVEVAEEAVSLINTMRLAKHDSNRLRLLIFGFCVDKKGKKNIDVVGKITQQDLEDTGLDAYQYLMKEVFKMGVCTYVLYDCRYENSEGGPREELVFVMWCHEGAAIVDKMNFACSKKALSAKMQGVKYRVEVNELGEINTKKLFTECIGRPDILCLEGERV